MKLICDASSKLECDRLIFVTGPGIKADFICESDKIVKMKFLDNMMEWIKISDVIVTLAGHTTIMEIISLGIPNIIIPIDNHPEQLKNAVNIKKYGISIVKELKNLDPDEISEDINRLLNDSEIMKRAETVKEMFSHYHGTDDAVKIIMENAMDSNSLNK